MTTDTKLFVIKWYNHYNDKHLIEEYDQLENLFGKHKADFTCLHDCDAFGVFEYDTKREQDVRSFENGLFEPEYYLSLEDWINEYYLYDDNRPEQINSAEFFSELEYQAELGRIMKECGGDEREFERLWTEEFVFG